MLQEDILSVWSEHNNITEVILTCQYWKSGVLSVTSCHPALAPIYTYISFIQEMTTFPLIFLVFNDLICEISHCSRTKETMILFVCISDTV